MRKLAWWRAAVCAAASVTALCAQTADTAYFQAVMSPANETPPITGFNTSGLGTLIAHVVRDTSGQITSGSVDFWIDYNYPQALTATGLHIHKGPVGVAAAVVINTGLSADNPLIDPTGVGRVERQAQVLASDAVGVASLQQLFQDPTQFYVNMHSTEYGGGFIRGQLQRADVTRVIGLMNSANESPAIAANGVSAVSSVTAIAARDANGAFTSATVIFDVNYTTASPVTFTGLHIHKGGAGTAGPIVIPTTLANTASDASGKGTLHYAVNVNTVLSAAQDAVNGIFTNPGGYYINVHTTVNPGGAARAQLRATDSLTIPVVLLTSNEVPAITGVNASAPGQVVVNTIRGDDGAVIAGVVTFDANYRFPGAQTITGFHIHDGAAGVNGPVIINTGLSAAVPVLTTSGSGNVFRTVTVGDSAGVSTLNSIVATPDQQYINMHTVDHPGGIFRSQLGVAPAGPPAVTAVITAASDPSLKTLAPGELVSIYGTNLGRTMGNLLGFTGTNVPTALNGVKVTVGGKSAPLIFTSTSQLNAQVPFEVGMGAQAVVVTANGTASASFNVTVVPSAPAIFFDGVGGIVVKNSDFSLIRPENQARAGEILLVYATGLGQTTPALSTGALVSTLNSTSPATVTIGGAPAEVVYSLASPGFTGLYQVAVRVPAAVRSGNQTLQLTVNGQASNAVPVGFR